MSTALEDRTLADELRRPQSVAGVAAGDAVLFASNIEDAARQVEAGFRELVAKLEEDIGNG
jgi:hypothetical protein